jgi:hypothetical protein
MKKFLTVSTLFASLALYSVAFADRDDRRDDRREDKRSDRNDDDRGERPSVLDHRAQRPRVIDSAEASQRRGSVTLSVGNRSRARSLSLAIGDGVKVRSIEVTYQNGRTMTISKREARDGKVEISRPRGVVSVTIEYANRGRDRGGDDTIKLIASGV